MLTLVSPAVPGAGRATSARTPVFDWILFSLDACVVFEESDVGLTRFKQQGWCYTEHSAESARQVCGVRESSEVGSVGQARSTHRRVCRSAEAAPQNVSPQRHAGYFAEAVRQPARREVHGLRPSH